MQLNFSAIRQNLYGLGFLLALIILGFCIYQDYGVSWDENSQRIIGYFNLEYLRTGDDALLQNFTDRDHGGAFELPLAWLEAEFAPDGFTDGIRLRHICSFLFFLSGVWCGYLLALRLFKKQWIAIIGMAMLVLQPRIFAHAFFNSKDVPFLAAMLIALYAVHVALAGKRSYQYILAGAACGYATGIRTPGLLLVVLAALAMLPDIIKSDGPRWKRILHPALFGITALLALYLSWPVLRAAPLQTLRDSLGSFSSFQRFGGTVLLNGTAYQPKDLPWYYAPEWFLISTPVLWLLIGITGGVLGIRTLIRRRGQALTTPKARIMLICAGLFLLPLLLVITLKSVIYDDWRHLYFIYPAFVMIGLYGIHRLSENPRLPNVIGVLVTVEVLATGIFMIRAHPFQHVYFNALVPHRPEYLRKHFDYEYWGTSNRQALDYVLTHDTRDTIPVIWLDNAMTSNAAALAPEQRARIRWVTQETPGAYLLATYRYHPEDYPYQKVWGIQVGGSTLMQIYRTGTLARP
jgi:hypothetical protein